MSKIYEQLNDSHFVGFHLRISKQRTNKMFQKKFRKDFSNRRNNWLRKAIKSLMKNAGLCAEVVLVKEKYSLNFLFRNKRVSIYVNFITCFNTYA